jgi:hypothetical protein
MLIYGIVRVIRERKRHCVRNLSCIFPEGNRHIDVVLIGVDDKFKEIWKIKLDPKEISLTTIPENGTQIF